MSDHYTKDQPFLAQFHPNSIQVESVFHTLISYFLTCCKRESVSQYLPIILVFIMRDSSLLPNIYLDLICLGQVSYRERIYFISIVIHS